MIDELQDQNHVRRVLVERLMLKGGRFCGWVIRHRQDTVSPAPIPTPWN